MKKVIVLVILGMFLLLVGNVSAQVLEVDTSSYNWWDNLLYELEQIGLFTAAGQARECSIYADDTINPASGYYDFLRLIAPCQGPSALINFYNSDWGFIDEYQIEIIGDGININGVGILETYCCPYAPCSSNADCSSPPASDYGNTCNPTYGSCYSTQPSHQTTVYRCTGGNWDYWKTVNYGEENWCSNDNYNNYVPEGQSDGGCYSSPPEGWCVSCQPEGYSCTQSSQCCSGLTCQNFGCYSPPVCGDGICQSTETMSSCPSDCGTDIPNCGDGDCEPGETQGATYECESDCGPWNGNGDGLVYNEGDCDLNSDCVSGLVCIENGNPLYNDRCCNPGETLPFNFFSSSYCTNETGDGNGDGEEWIVTKSYEYEEIQDLTSNALADVVCNDISQCPSNSSCVVVDNLIKKGYLTESKRDITRKDFCELQQEGLGFWTFKAWTDDDYFSTCKALTGKTKYFDNHYGFCISGEEPSTGLDEIFGWAALYDLDGDGDKDGVDGLIIVIGGFILIMMFSRMMIFGRFEYVYEK